MMNTPSIQILVAEDSNAFRDGLRDLFKATPDMTLVGEAINGLEAVDLAKRDAEKVKELLTNVAVQKTIEMCISIAPRASPSAEYAVGNSTILTEDRDVAHVDKDSKCAYAISRPT